MSRTRRDAPAVKTYADHEVIVPAHELSRAVTLTGTDIGPDLAAIERAEQALSELKTEFEDWMKLECDRLDAARLRAKAEGIRHAVRDQLFHAAHDIKGEAKTFGYPLAAEVAESLCRLIEHTPDPRSIPFTLVDQHVDGIRAIIREDARESSDPVGSAMVTRLRHVTDEFLVHANRRRLGYLDGIVITPPPLAPRE